MTAGDSPAEAETTAPPAADHAMREAFTMAMYVAITLLAVMVADLAKPSKWDDIWLLVGTTVGVVLAHLVAFRLGAQLFARDGRGRLNDADRLSSWGVVGAAVTVGAVAILPYLVLPADSAAVLTTILLALVVGLGAWVTARSNGATHSKALVFAIAVTAIALAVALLKDYLSH